MMDPEMEHYLQLVERIEERECPPDVFSVHPTVMFCRLAQQPDVQLSDLKQHTDIFPRARLDAESLMALAANYKLEIIQYIDKHNLHDSTIDKHSMLPIWVEYYCGLKYNDWEPQQQSPSQAA